jgi:GT2 family glycosyltransferase
VALSASPPPDADAAPATRLCALLACHNRREHTLASLHALEVAAARVPLALQAVLVDDGSRDGTAAAVRSRFGWVEVIEADGSLFWCRAMHRAFARALERGGFDAVLWLNDDSHLAPDALQRLHAVATAKGEGGRAPVIVVGSLVAGPLEAGGAVGAVEAGEAVQAIDSAQAVGRHDLLGAESGDPPVAGRGEQPGAHAPSYGGRVAASRWRRTAWRLVPPGPEPQALDTLDGNLVWINSAAVRRVGNLDPAFEHAMGDVDYGLRARRLGVPLWLAPGVCGHCAPNPVTGGFRDRSLPLARRWRAMLAPKGLPWRSWLRLTRRHAGPLWPLFFAWPYVRVLLEAGLPRHAARRVR